MKRLIASVALSLMCVAMWADSPLTSTSFYEAYGEHPMVQLAASMISEGEADLPIALMEFFADQKQPVATRLAAVNAVGWNFNGTNTSHQFRDYLMTRFKAKNEKKLLKKIDAGTLAVYAYACAMSDYFNVQNAQKLAHEAVKKDRTKSFSIAFIAALIDSQKYLDDDWCMVYKVVADVTHDGSLRLDMNQAAIDAVMEYINLYKEYCK